MKIKRIQFVLYIILTFIWKIRSIVSIPNFVLPFSHLSLFVDSNALTHLKLCSPLFSQCKRIRGPGKKQTSGVRVLSRMFDHRRSMIFIAYFLFWDSFPVNISSCTIYRISFIDNLEGFHIDLAVFSKLLKLVQSLLIFRIDSNFFSLILLILNDNIVLFCII